MIFTAWSIGQLAKHIPAAGSVATYNAVGLAPWVGLPRRLGLCGGRSPHRATRHAAARLQRRRRVELRAVVVPHGLWWIFMVAGMLLICFLVYRGVKTSTRTGVVLGFIEVIVFLALSIVLVIKAGNHNTLAVFTTHYANAEGYAGMTGVIAGAVGALLAFSGFEAAAPLAEETRNRRTQCPAGCHPLGDPDRCPVHLHHVRGHGRVRAGEVLGLCRFRERCALGRAGSHCLDGLLGARALRHHQLHARERQLRRQRVHAHGLRLWSHRRLPARVRRPAPALQVPESRHPRRADPRSRRRALPWASSTRHRWPSASSGTAIVVIVVPVYIATNIACVGYFARHRRDEQHWLSHIVVPIIGALLLHPRLLQRRRHHRHPGTLLHLGPHVALQVRALRDGRVAGRSASSCSSGCARAARRRSTKSRTSTSRTRGCERGLTSPF